MPGECAGIRVAPASDGYEVSLAFGDRVVSRRAASLQSAMLWVETWVGVSEAPTPTVAQVSVEEDSERPPRFRPHAIREPGPAAPRWEIGLLGRGGMDEGLAPWLGAELALSVAVAKVFWVGGLLGSTWALNESSSRNTLRAGLRGGLLTAPAPVVFRGGLGVGFYTGTTDGLTEGGATGRFRGGGAFGELMVELSVRLGGPVRGVFGADVRVSSTQAPSLRNEHEATPARLPRVVAALRLGVAFGFGAER